jgi:C1A family cysteine protease
MYTTPIKANVAKTIENYYALTESIESSNEPLPAKFDLRDYGLVTAKRSQGNYGMCWAFGTVAALESNALVKGIGTYDLSERYFGWCSKHIIATNNNNISGEGVVTSQDDWYEGGQTGWTTHALMNGYGLAMESDYPYRNIKEDILYTTQDSQVLKCIGVRVIPRNDWNAIKNAIIKYGAIELSIASMSDKSKIFNSRTHSYYISEEYYNNNKSKHSGGHILAIIGWDDNYSKNNFTLTPPGDGAWIVKNSGGLNYSYISYYNYVPSDCADLRAYEVAPIETYDSLYTYDGGVGLTELKSISDVAISFKTNGDETLTGVAVKVAGKATATIKVYNNIDSLVNLNEGNCIYTQTVNLTENGYQTLQFNKGVNLSANKDVFITVHFSNPIIYYIDNRRSSGTLTSIASANPNETFIKKDSGNWEDLVNYNKASACIKVLSRNGHNRRPLTLSNSNLTVNNTKEATIDLTWKEVEGAESYEIYRKAEGEWKYTLLKTVSNTTLKYSDTKLTLGKKYTYKVIPVAGNVEGFSAEKTLTATIAATWIKKLDNSKSGKITITINKTKTAKSYSVYRYNGKEYKWIGNTTTGTFVDKNVTSGTTYTYKVKANKGSLSSAYSAAKSSKAK